MDGFFAALDASLPRTSPGRILEVGVGEGEVTARLADALARRLHLRRGPA